MKDAGAILYSGVCTDGYRLELWQVIGGIYGLEMAIGGKLHPPVGISPIL